MLILKMLSMNLQRSILLSIGLKKSDDIWQNMVVKINSKRVD